VSHDDVSASLSRDRVHYREDACRCVCINRRKRKKTSGRKSGVNVGPGAAPPSSSVCSKGRDGPVRAPVGQRRELRAIPRRSPRSAAVAITCEDGDPTYADALKRTKDRISLADLEIIVLGSEGLRRALCS